MPMHAPTYTREMGWEPRWELGRRGGGGGGGGGGVGSGDDDDETHDDWIAWRLVGGVGEMIGER